MGQALVDHFPAAREVFDTVAEATQVDTFALCFQLDDDTLRQTENAQLALFTAGAAAAAALKSAAPTLQVAAYAGHSVGEYTALAAAGAISIADGARLVRRRGELMANSGHLRPGTMAAVLGLAAETLAEVCAAVDPELGVAVIANDNCPGQLVISGDVAAVAAAGAAASAAGAKRVLPLNVSGAFHSPLMETPALAMGEALRAVTWHAPTAPVVANVTATAVTEAAPWASLLEQQLRAPVRWTESVGTLRGMGIHYFVELGTGEVLSGLLKRIDRTAEALPVQDPESLNAAVRRLQEVAA